MMLCEGELKGEVKALNIVIRSNEKLYGVIGDDTVVSGEKKGGGIVPILYADLHRFPTRSPEDQRT